MVLWGPMGYGVVGPIAKCLGSQWNAQSSAFGSIGVKLAGFSLQGLLHQPLGTQDGRVVMLTVMPGQSFQWQRVLGWPIIDHKENWLTRKTVA